MLLIQLSAGYSAGCLQCSSAQSLAAGISIKAIRELYYKRAIYIRELYIESYTYKRAIRELYESYIRVREILWYKSSMQYKRYSM